MYGDEIEVYRWVVWRHTWWLACGNLDDDEMDDGVVEGSNFSKLILLNDLENCLKNYKSV